MVARRQVALRCPSFTPDIPRMWHLCCSASSRATSGSTSVIRWKKYISEPSRLRGGADWVPRHTLLRDDETELLRLSVDLRGSPILVLLRQSSDHANLLGDLRSTAERPGSPAPTESKAGAVPADYGLGLDDEQNIRPAGPTLPECRPEESVQGVQFRPWPFPFQDGDPLSEGDDLKARIAPTAKEDADGHEEGKDDFDHESTLLTQRNVASPGRGCDSQVADSKPS